MNQPQRTRTPSTADGLGIKPLAHAITALLVAGGMIGTASAQQAFSAAWFANKGANQQSAAQSGRLPNGQPSNLPRPEQQNREARDKLKTSIENLATAAQAIAMQQRLQQAARDAASLRAPTVPDGLGEGGLKVDQDALTRGWHNAKDPTQQVADGKTTVTIEQTADKAILNWESFNVGRNTTVDFKQDAAWSVLNRINDPSARPSQIQGQIKADGTVFLINRNGVVFNGTSQVNVKNLAASAVGMTDAQFRSGLYSQAQGKDFIPTFANDLTSTASSFQHGAATGAVTVEQGARITTHVPTSVTEGGGYVLLVGQQVQNHGQIATANGQTTLAAGDAFVIRKGMDTDGNQASTTRGNLVSTLRLPATSGTGTEGSAPATGMVTNTGLIQATTGDISLVGHEVRQQGAVIATTSVHTRGTVHLTSDATDADSRIVLDKDSTTAVVLDESATTALDVQRETLVRDTDKPDGNATHRRDQSLIRISSGGDVDFQGQSLTLATGGQVLVDAAGRSTVADGARIDVSGAVGVRIAMEANNVLINVQGNEQRDASGNRDDKSLNNSNIWLDRRDLVLVPAGTNGYETDRWYTAGGLLEVGGYLGVTGHGIGEWSAQGGTVQFSGGEVVTRQGSHINLSGGTLDVQTGYVNQTFLKGADGKLYNASNAPGDLLYTGLYKGFEDLHERWGSQTTSYYYNPLIAPRTRLEGGYVVGRDAGKLVVATRGAVLEGDVEGTTFQGDRQQRTRDAALDGYQQAQTAAARGASLIIGSHRPVYDKNTGDLRYSPDAVVSAVTIGDAVPGAEPEAGRIALDADWLNRQGLGGLEVYARGGVRVDEALTVSPGGEIALHASQVDVNADLTARSGSIRLGNMVVRHISAEGGSWQETAISEVTPPGYARQTNLADGVTLDARGLWNNRQHDPLAIGGLPYVDGGSVSLRSDGNVVLGKDSLIDVSSGATLGADDRLHGGRGGNVSLAAGLVGGAGVLSLDGTLRGHGVNGGGKLDIEHGTLVSIGDGVPQIIEQLQAGETSDLPLRLANDYVIPAGQPIPMDFSVVMTRVLGDQPVPVRTRPLISEANPVTLQAEWRLPTAVLLANGTYQYAGTVLPAGTVLHAITELEAGYVVPRDVFPDGLPITAYTATYQGGSIAATDIVVPRGQRIPPGTAWPETVEVQSFLALDGALFQSGFGAYAIHGRDGVLVQPGTELSVLMPLLDYDRDTARRIASGADPSEALSVWLPPTQADDPDQGRTTLRRGASLSLTAGSIYANGVLEMGKDSRIEVDPGQSITLTGNDQITIEGELRAHGGRISILPGAWGQGLDRNRPNGKPNGRSIWIGDDAVLDVSGRAYTGVDANGRRFGQVLDGGTIEIGARHDLEAREFNAVDAFLVVRRGARLEASGAQATLDLPGLGGTLIPSHGGVIALSASNGLYIDGQLRAAAGGAGAAGGTLALNLETPLYREVGRWDYLGDDVDDAVRVPRELLLEQNYGGSGLADDAEAGQMHESLVYGQARYGVDAIRAGGFDTTALHVNGLLSFAGDIDLRMRQALYLTASGIGLGADAARDSRVTLAAPYLRLSGSARRQGDGEMMPNPVFGSRNVSAGNGTLGAPGIAEGSALRLDADLIDIVGEVGMGANGAIIHNSGTPLEVRRDAFEALQLHSRGDLRLRGAKLFSPGDTLLEARQIYGKGDVIVGLRSRVNQWNNLEQYYDPDSRLDITRVGSELPPMPYSVFGAMSFAAATVNQGGVLRAPLGTITLGSADSNGKTGLVNLLPGSVTSVSARGLVIPYGGTVDGLVYQYEGTDVEFRGLGNEPKVEFQSHAVNAQAGATVDLSGGGELAGAAFLSGRGGSTDARLHPLVQMAADGSGFTLPGLSTNPVYAIVPGVQAGQAPVGGEQGAGAPALGRQITIGAGVPGLPPGTYTLLPSTYALLPGAFRVEINGLANSAASFGSTTAMRNGSWSTAAQLGTANTGLRDVLPTQVILTSADTLRSYSQYNETSYAQFAIDSAARDGVPRALLERDAKAISLRLIERSEEGSRGEPALRFDATVLAKPEEGGHGSLTNLWYARNYEILADGAAPTEGFTGVSVHASELNAIGGARLVVGGRLTSTQRDHTGSQQRANQIGIFGNSTANIVLREGAVLEGTDVFLISSRVDGAITLEQGAGINTLGKGASTFGAEQGYVYTPGQNSVLAVSNGALDLLAPDAPNSDGGGAGAIEIGVCAAGGSCAGETRLYSEGTIATATDNRFVLGDEVRYGTRNLVLAVGGINVGSQAALADAAARGALPAGMTLNQQVLDRLLLGDTRNGAPALQNLALTVRESINFYGSVSLSTFNPVTGKSALEQLVLGAPAIYGYGDADDVARIHTDTLVWTGSRLAGGNVVAQGPGTGSGQLTVDARVIDFGHATKSQPDTVRSYDRMTLGFAGVDLNASERVTASHKGTLSVYQSQGEWDPAAKAFTYHGGDLNISTPLLTGAAGSVNRITAGGDVRVTGTGGVAPAMASDALGAEIALDSRGGRLLFDGLAWLPSGKLTLSAQDDVVLGDAARLDLAGRKLEFFDVSKYSWGGDVVLESRAGDVSQSAGAQIDLSARFNRAGKLGAFAQAGTVDLAGRILGASSGHYDAGGTEVPFMAGRIDVHGLHIDDFGGLNARLTADGVTGARSFRLGEGDLVVGNEIKAHEVNVSLDKGHLTVDGVIDASGEQAGSIRLAARDGVTLTGGAVLDASADVLRRDSYGQVIEAPNRAVIEVDSGAGLLRIDSGARMDLRVAGADRGYGTVALNAPRIGGDDVAIDARGDIAIEGAKTITVNAFTSDDSARPGVDATTDGGSYQIIDQDYLDRLHGQNTAFITAALGNTDLMEHRLAGLCGYRDQFHLRPGVQIVSSTDPAINPDGNLHVDGDLDLSGYRYASVNPHSQQTATRGSGEAGALVIRARGDLEVFGSISDGFDGSRLSPGFDDQGWILTKGRQPHGADVVVPHGGKVTLVAGTVFPSGKVLNYDVRIVGMEVAAGTQLPAEATLAQPLTLARGTVLGGPVFDAGGTLLYAAGTVLADTVTLPANTHLGAGLRLPTAARLGEMIWPAGIALPAPSRGSGVALAADLALAKGAFIPSETEVKLPGDVQTVDLRDKDADGHQGLQWALAPMLAAGSQSWDITLVGGADPDAADRLAVARERTGGLRLSDNHYGMGMQQLPVPGTGSPAVYRWGDAPHQEFVDLLSMFGYSFPIIAGAVITPAEVEELQLLGIIGVDAGELNLWGYGDLSALVTPATPPDMDYYTLPVREQLASVVRTGTGDLKLVSGDDILTTSLYGVYTAGTPSARITAADGSEPFNLPRGAVVDGTILGPSGGDLFEHLVDGGSQSLYQAWFPEAGGNLLLRARGDIMGDSVGKTTAVIRPDALGYRNGPLTGSASIGNWLWRQGSGSVGDAGGNVATAWWINFGTYIASNRDNGMSGFEGMPRMMAFTGFGTLGGGNLLLETGGDAGMLQGRGDKGYVIARSQGVNLAVASTGRVTASGELVQTGGGDLDIRIGGGLNPDPYERSFPVGNLVPEANTFPANNVHRLDLNGSFTNLRGALRMEAGAVGGVELRHGGMDPKESRANDVYTATAATSGGGPLLVLGDATARIDTRGDLVLTGAADGGRVPQFHGGSPYRINDTLHDGGGWNWFSLWTPSTAVDLFAAGGNLTPTLGELDRGSFSDFQATDGNFIYPSTVRAVAASGSLFYGINGLANGVVLAPSPVDGRFVVESAGQLELLARDSIYAGGNGFSVSGADPTRLPSPFNPGFVGFDDNVWYGRRVWHNVSPDALAPSALFAFGHDGPLGTSQAYPLFSFTPPTASGHVYAGRQPARYYAVEGDLVGLQLGGIVYRGLHTGERGNYPSWYDGGGAVAVRAGRDIVNAGTQLGQFDTLGQNYGQETGALGWFGVPTTLDLSAPHKPNYVGTGTSRGNLIVHTSADDVSVVEAGRDIRFSSFYIAGPGELELTAGRDVYMADKAELRSIGPVYNVTPGDRGSGAGITVMAGVGEHGADWAAFAARYLDPANQADPERPLGDQPGKAVRIYDGSLTLAQWLAREFGYAGDEAGATAFMLEKQAELDRVRNTALAAGKSASNRNLTREFQRESDLHLVNWLTARFGGANGLGLHFDAAVMDARAFFAALPPEQQRVFLRNVYYNELKTAGREYNQDGGPREGSYLRGREAIATLLPAKDSAGNAIRYEGGLTMFSSALYYETFGETPSARPRPGQSYIREDEWFARGRPGGVPFYKVLDAGIHTDFGGDINLLVPGGRTLVGVDGGFTPAEGSGVLTQGDGDINMYSQGSILLGQSRIFTTFGGNILAWSAEGDINAGRGSKTTIVYTPQRRAYDAIGNVSLSPTTPNTGAGIATLNPIAEVPPGDVDLIAPLGTIDAGEAGIRVSGNVNLAALRVVNAENIQVQGEAKGIPVVAAVNVSALSNASSAATSAVQAAQDVVKRQNARNRPSVISVQVLGFGADASGAAPRGGEGEGYDANSVVQVSMGDPAVEPRKRPAPSNPRQGRH
ncbi:filamentous hemagglutinin family protein [Pseudoxanthomonas sp. 22568]|uniref:filamentous haemagglutinin family protein n=1 Tax=Pseudoxanthomonas sp. 22568 TaxID=3453945 RepID=UPI003F87D23D